MLLAACIKAIRAWIAADLASTPAQKLAMTRLARLAMGDCFNKGLVDAEKELAKGGADDE